MQSPFQPPSLQAGGADSLHHRGRIFGRENYREVLSKQFIALPASHLHKCIVQKIKFASEISDAHHVRTALNGLRQHRGKFFRLHLGRNGRSFGDWFHRGDFWIVEMDAGNHSACAVIPDDDPSAFGLPGRAQISRNIQGAAARAASAIQLQGYQSRGQQIVCQLPVRFPTKARLSFWLCAGGEWAVSDGCRNMYRATFPGRNQCARQRCFYS